MWGFPQRCTQTTEPVGYAMLVGAAYAIVGAAYCIGCAYVYEGTDEATGIEVGIDIGIIAGISGTSGSGTGSGTGSGFGAGAVLFFFGFGFIINAASTPRHRPQQHNSTITHCQMNM